jgi:hypothetical protein
VIYDKKNRLLLFALGASLGLLAGGSLVYFSTRHSGDDKLSQGFIEDIANRVAGLLSSQKEEKPVSQNTVSKNRKGGEAIVKKSTGISETADSLANDKSVVSITQADSSAADTSNTGIHMENEEIIVKKDVLLNSSTIELVNLELPDKRQQRSDSLVQAATGLKDENKLTESKYNYHIEYWQSPVNYKGYKLGKSKLILFGLEPGTATKMYYLNDNVYLYFKQQEAFYKLDYSNDFKAFEKVTNNGTIAQLQLNK